MKAFREERGISLREAARQLHVKHPALKDWEDGRKLPSPPYRDAIEVWTEGLIKAGEWPLTKQESEAVKNTALVRPAVVPPRERESSKTLANDTDAVDRAATGTDGS